MKLKKIGKFRYFLYFLALSAAIVIAQAINTFTITNANAITGSQNVPVPVNLDNDDELAGFQYEVNYTTFLTFKGLETTSRMPNATIEVNSETPGLLRIAAVSEALVAPGNGAIMSIIFDVDENAVPDNYAISASNLLASDINATLIQTEAAGGAFAIVAPYNFSFLPPISLFENFTLQEGATLPLKFSVKDVNDNFVVDDSVLVRIYNLSLGIDKEYNASGEGDDFIRINGTEEQYIVNIHTNELGMPLGRYDIDVTFSNLQEEEIGFDLVQYGLGKGRKK